MIKRDLERGLEIPREITLDPWAVERLYEWGATDEFVRVLADVLPQYSYKGTVQRLSWWHERNEAFLAGGDRGDEIGLFPHWYNVGFGYGQCGELAGQLRTNQVFLSALEDLNLDLSRRGRNRIELYECWGRSREFFCVPPLRHVWNGLLPEGVSPWEIVDVDVAMGRVDVGTHVMEDCRKRSWWQHPLTASFTVLPWEYKDNMDLVRLGAKVLGESGLNIIADTDLTGAAKKVVAAAANQ